MALAWTLLFTKVPLDAWMVFLQLASKQTLQGRLRQTTCNHSWQKSTGTVVITSFHRGGEPIHQYLQDLPVHLFVADYRGYGTLAYLQLLAGLLGEPREFLRVEVGQVANHLWQLFWKTSGSQMALPLLFPWFHWAIWGRATGRKIVGAAQFVQFPGCIQYILFGYVRIFDVVWLHFH